VSRTRVGDSGVYRGSVVVQPITSRFTCTGLVLTGVASRTRTRWCPCRRAGRSSRPLVSSSPDREGAPAASFTDRAQRGGAAETRSVGGRFLTTDGHHGRLLLGGARMHAGAADPCPGILHFWGPYHARPQGTVR
jgi:hypothetical protein